MCKRIWEVIAFCFLLSAGVLGVSLRLNAAKAPAMTPQQAAVLLSAAALDLREELVEPEAVRSASALFPRDLVRGEYHHNVLVNNPDLDTPEMTTQSETSLAIHAATVCVGYNNASTPSPQSGSGFARSVDGGRSWTDNGVTAPLDRRGDPVLAVDQRTGTFYYAELALVGGRTATEALTSAIEVQRSDDDCQMFGEGAIASISAAQPSVCGAPVTKQCKGCRRNSDCDSLSGAGDGRCIGPDIEDKPWLAVDSSLGPHAGNVYVCWTRFRNANTASSVSTEVHFARSADGGASFELDRIVSAPSESAFGCQVAVGATGDVFVAWKSNVSNQDTKFAVRVRRSPDGGNTWDPPPSRVATLVTAMPFRDPGTDSVVTCGSGTVCGRSYAVQRTALKGSIRVGGVAGLSMAVDTSGGPLSGSVYLAWDADPSGLQDNSDAFVTRSTDNGATWAAPIQLGSDSMADQFFPTLTVGPGGAVSVAWYERRDDPSGAGQLDVYASISRGADPRFTVVQRLTDVSFGIPPLSGQPTDSGNFNPRTSACYMGDYIASAADDTDFYYAWGDNRSQVISTTYPAGRPDPDIVFDRRLACVGDCDSSGDVDVTEIISGVNIVLGNQLPESCSAFGTDGLTDVTTLVKAIRSDLEGCL